MAKVLAQNFSIDFSQVVKNAVTAIKTTRRKEQARKEAEFQRSIANGLSYEEQLKLREKWLKEEKDSGFPDEEYIATLEKSVADTKKLNRFNKYREKYVATLNELNAGKINEVQYLKELEGQLEGITDPELRLEIQGDIAEASKSVKNYNDTIIKNQVTFASKDGTVKVLDEAINRVNAARADATISDNQDEVTMWDETLFALRGQLNTVKVENSIQDFQAKSATLGVSPIEKLDFINNQLNNSDADAPFRVGEKTYASQREYWTQQRDQYLAGQSETLGGNFFEELKVYTDENISIDSARFGYTTQQALDAANLQFSQLATRSELTPFLVNLDNTRTSSMNGIVLPSPTSTPVPSTTSAPGSTVVPSTTSAPGSTPTPTPTPAPTPEPTPASTPTPGTPPAAPAQPDGTPSNPFPGQPLFTPGSGIGTISADGKFMFTDTGWKPTPEGAAGSPQAPQYTPGSGDMTLSPDGKFIYRLNKGWEPVTATTPITKVGIPEAQPVPIPPSTPVAIPQAEPLKIPQAEPLAQATPPNYSPAGGIGTKSSDGRFVFTKKGWEPSLAMPKFVAPNINLASPIAAFKNIFNPKKDESAPVVPAPAPTPVTPTPVTKEYVVVAGDTLGAIAKRSGKTVQQLAQDNQIADPNKIKVGQKLKL